MRASPPFFFFGEVPPPKENKNTPTRTQTPRAHAHATIHVHDPRLTPRKTKLLDYPTREEPVRELSFRFILLSSG